MINQEEAMFLNQIGQYWNTRAQGYSNTINEQFEGEIYEYFNGYLRKCAPEGENIKCVDMGCGPGYFSILLAKMGYEVTAFDYSEGMLEKARENFAAKGVNPKTVQGDVQNPPFEDESVDYIVSRNLIWNLEQPEQAYKEWIRILKPGGRILIFDANHYLHYFDEEYDQARETIKQKRIQEECMKKENGVLTKIAVEGHKYMDGVNPKIIDDIARELPLSKEYRPQWDVNQMLRLGMDNINVSVSRRRVNEDDASKCVVGDFVLCVEKPM